jgi:hypothetical protein
MITLRKNKNLVSQSYTRTIDFVNPTLRIYRSGKQMDGTTDRRVVYVVYIMCVANPETATEKFKCEHDIQKLSSFGYTFRSDGNTSMSIRETTSDE